MRARLGVRRVLAVAAITSTATVSAGAGQRPVFRGGVDLVAVDVSARFRGQPLLGLQAADFELLDNGEPQEIVDVSYGSLPIDITLAIDLGFTSSEFAGRLRQAVNDLVSRLNDNDRVRLILLNSRVPRATDFTTDAGMIDRALRDAKAGGQSPFADVVGDALASASPTDRRHLVVFVTDGVLAPARSRRRSSTSPGDRGRRCRSSCRLRSGGPGALRAEPRAGRADRLAEPPRPGDRWHRHLDDVQLRRQP